MQGESETDSAFPLGIYYETFIAVKLARAEKGHV
jgi:hypothetical protein